MQAVKTTTEERGALAVKRGQVEAFNSNNQIRRRATIEESREDEPKLTIIQKLRA